MTALSDRELLDLFRHEPQLLAIADAVTETQRPARRRVPGRRAAAAALAVAAAIAVALVAPWNDSGPNVVDRALAAVGAGPVVHAVVEYSWDRDVVVGIATGEEQRRVHRTEYWYDQDRQTLRTRLLTDGVQLTEIVETPQHAWSDVGDFPTRGNVPQLDPVLAGFLIRYRDALEDGSAEVVGETTVDGQAAKLIRFSARPSGSVQEVAVDAKSYTPLRFHHTYPGGRRSPEWHVVAIESIPRDPSLFARPPLSKPRPTQGWGLEGSRIELGDASRVLGAPALWVGATFAGREIEEVLLQRVAAELTDGTEVEGVVLRIAYTDGIRVSQAVDPAGLYALGIDDGGDPAAPAGSMTVFSDPRPHSQGELVVGRIGVVLDAPTRELLLAAARELRPMR
jgi:hypothetical protein